MSKLSRTTWAAQNDYCWLCGWRYGMFHDSKFRLETHEMLGGPDRHKAVVEPCCWVRLCNVCHNEFQGTPLVKQLALKKIHDFENYDREKVLRIRNPRAMRYVTEAEVDEIVEVLE